MCASTALTVPLNGTLIFLSAMFPFVPFSYHLMWVGMSTRPIPGWALISSGHAAYLISQEQEQDKDSQDLWGREEDLFFLLEERYEGVTLKMAGAILLA